VTLSRQTDAQSAEGAAYNDCARVLELLAQDGPQTTLELQRGSSLGYPRLLAVLEQLERDGAVVVGRRGPLREFGCRR
jgi:hypothetical protein